MSRSLAHFPMVAAIAFAWGAAGAAPGDRLGGGIELEGMSFVDTSGTLTLRSFEADHSELTDDGMRIEALGARLDVSEEKKLGRIRLNAARATYFLRPTAAPARAVPRERGLGRLEATMEAPTRGRAKGDWLMLPPEDATGATVRCDAEGRGHIEATSLLWDGASKSYLCWGPYKTELDIGKTGRATISGDSMIFSRNMTDFTFWAKGNTPVALEFQSSPAKPQGRPR